ncbi:hypothetical protein COCMIDRAFT_7162 [Bipolaris oryzae ATCC 44560]|uniref:Gfd2/YDR514C-like C-terminal domain-containing protein n=1 Tax=Bipolaris oryzae ATCC 44560 TaxID=930090 RepID=W6Z134_COCMI|nr:uncharacterized protein COCMIDRAFT_7162 [Bipolaris oryzae ATCC 44560]EUC43403.1 hypothetical protein COCMIDRAFT_7162 [Bipolaris oryzae ATCC 44560]
MGHFHSSKPPSASTRDQVLAPPTEEFPASSIGDLQVSERMQDVAHFFQGMSHTEMLEFCLGFEKPNTPVLAEHVVLIAVQCGELSRERPALLDIGIHTVKRRDMQEKCACPGPHSLNIVRNASYHHMCIQDNARYVNLLEVALDSQKTCFGRTRFIDGKEAKVVLESFLRQPVEPLPTGEEYCAVSNKYLVPGACPIVILQDGTWQRHALLNTLGLEQIIGENTVSMISTLQIAREMGFGWRDKALTLGQLATDLKIDFPEHRSAADFAAYTLITSIQMVMRPKIPLAKQPIQSVINVAMLHSQCNQPLWGNEHYCSRCGQDDHSRKGCCVMQIIRMCSKCAKAERHPAAWSHVAQMCPW